MLKNNNIKGGENLESGIMTGHGAFGLPIELERKVTKWVAIISSILLAVNIYINDNNLWFISLILFGFAVYVFRRW
ncbi:MAG: hypothetical protein ABH986_01565 [archaeon]